MKLQLICRQLTTVRTSRASPTTLFVLVFAWLTLISAVPLSAIDGRNAVGMCIDSTAGGSRCEWSVNDKGEVDICNANGCIYCPSATSECSVASRRPRPTHGLPDGTKVTTVLGTFTVKPHAINGPLLGNASKNASISESAHE